MGLLNVFNVMQNGLVAQTSRLNLIAENLANADIAASSAEEAYKGQYPVFSSFFDQQNTNSQGQSVRYEGSVEDDRAPRKVFEPGNPKADEDGFVYLSNVNSVEEMANLMEASRSYQTNVEVMNTSKDLLMRTIRLGEA